MFQEIDYMLRFSLAYKAGERVCLIRDRTYENIASQIILYCNTNKIHVDEIVLDEKDKLPTTAKKAFLSDTNQIILIASKRNFWHNRYRKDAKYKKNKRLANILHPDSPCPSYMTDYHEMTSFGEKLRKLLETAREKRESVIIRTKEGTNLVARIGKVFCETGDYSSPRTGGDYPAGEVGFGPVQGSVNGKLVYNYKIQHVGLLNSNIEVIVERDKIRTEGLSGEVKELISSHPAFEYLCEISLGINHIWSETTNKHSIIEEKNLGTVHFGHGGNSPSYGKRKGPHFDAVIKNPTIIIGKREIMVDGNYMQNI
jgi:leucyl aminopeptidase (aminopeptidase T)